MRGEQSHSLSVVENRPSFVQKVVHTEFHTILNDPAEGPVVVKEHVVDYERIVRTQNVYLTRGRLKMGR
jgi:hypothetical protein